MHTLDDITKAIMADPENKEFKLQNVAIDNTSGALVIRWSEIAEVFEK